MAEGTVERIDASELGGRRLRYFDFVMVAFVVVLLLSNVIGAAKLTFVEVSWWPDGWWPAADGVFIYGAGILFFPLGYVIGDILLKSTALPAPDE